MLIPAWNTLGRDRYLNSNDMFTGQYLGVKTVLYLEEKFTQGGITCSGFQLG